MQLASNSRALRGGLACQRQGPHRGLKCMATAAPVREVLEAGSQGFKADIPAGLNKYSSVITQPKSQGASQAMLYATGMTESDMNKPQVGWGGRRQRWAWG